MQDRRDVDIEDAGRAAGEVIANNTLVELTAVEPDDAMLAPQTGEETSVFSKALREGFWATLRRELSDEATTNPALCAECGKLFVIPDDYPEDRKWYCTDCVFFVPPAVAKNPDGSIDYANIPDASALFHEEKV
jgi:hypothetical protein